MSRYINWADVSNKYPQAAKLSAGAEGVKESWINGAEDEVDGYAARRYAVPFTPVPGVVRDLCIDLAYYKMIVLQPKLSKALGDYINSRLEKIADGTLILVTSGTQLATNDQAWSTDTSRSAFGTDPDIDWSVSSSQQATFSDARIGD